MSAERFLELVRALGGDVYVTSRGDIVLDAPAKLVAAVRWRVDEIGTRELAQELQGKLELAGAQVRARSLAAPVDELHQAGVR